MTLQGAVVGERDLARTRVLLVIRFIKIQNQLFHRLVDLINLSVSHILLKCASFHQVIKLSYSQGFMMAGMEWNPRED